MFVIIAGLQKCLGATTESNISLNVDARIQQRCVKLLAANLFPVNWIQDFVLDFVLLPGFLHSLHVGPSAPKHDSSE